MLNDERRREIEAEEAKLAEEEAYRQELRSRLNYTAPAASPSVPNPLRMRTQSGASIWLRPVLTLVFVVGVAFVGVASTFLSTYPWHKHNSQPKPSVNLVEVIKPIYVPVKKQLASGQIVVKPHFGDSHRFHF